MARSTATETRNHILETFLRLIGERGIDATTTRLLAREAGVNEVTVFRHFSTKEDLVAALIKRYAPTVELSVVPEMDMSSTAAARASVGRQLRFLRDTLRERYQLLLIGLSDAWRHEAVRQFLPAVPLAAKTYIERVLVAAQAHLDARVDVQATALTLQSLVLVTVIWQARGWLRMTDEEWDALFEQALRPFFQEEEMV